MTTQIKYLAFKGIEKKEQILFKSFLNLAKNELEYQVVVLKTGHEDEPDILILDESYSFDDSEKDLETRPTILVGDDINNESDTYICRPVQWSEFKLALSQLTVDVVADDQPLERVLPSEIKFAINQHTESSVVPHSETFEQDSTDRADLGFEFDLENMSVDYNSFTSSEYVKVVDDVAKFNQLNSALSTNEPVVLITDDESSSSNSVLVIETNSNEAWDITLSEQTTINEIDQAVTEETESSTDDEVVLEQKVGLQMQPNEEYWLSDNEIIVDHQTLFYIKAEREMIYSTKEPGLWSEILREGTLSKLPMSSNWQPKNGFKAYPISCLSWVNALVNDVEELAPDLDQNTAYILNKWPQFDLIELDNSLLKLCTMLFVRSETIDSLMSKSGYSRATIVGLINACHSINILSAANDFDQDNSVSALSTEGVFGKIKDVFR